MLTVTCPHCKKTLQIPEEYAGKTGTCNHCGKRLTIFLTKPSKAAAMRHAFSTLPAQQQASLLSCGCFMLVGLAVLGMFGYFYVEGSIRSARIDRRIESGRPDFRVEATQLVRDVQRDGIAARQKYEDKVLEVTGTVEGVLNDSLNQVVYLGPSVGDLAVWCYFDESYHSGIAQLSAGRTLTVRGYAQIGFGTVYLHKCRW